MALILSITKEQLSRGCQNSSLLGMSLWMHHSVCTHQGETKAEEASQTREMKYYKDGRKGGSLLESFALHPEYIP